MKAVLSQYTNHRGNHDLLPTIEKDSIWTNTPNTIERLRVDVKPGEYCLILGIKGLKPNNYKVSIVGNVLVIVLEKEREYISSDVWQYSNHSMQLHEHTYTLFERSDVFLPGNNLKFIKSIRYADGELIIKVSYKNEEGFVNAE